MFWLWFIVACICLAVGLYIVGRLEADEDSKIGLFWCIFLGSLIWPAVLAVVISFGPFVGFYWLGERQRKKKKENSTKNK